MAVYMSKTLKQVVALCSRGEIRLSDHGYDELAEDGIFAKDVIAGVGAAIVLEDYPNYPKGACVLVLQKDPDGRPVHVVWGIPKNAERPAVVVTAYRPDPGKWTNDFMRRNP